MTSLGLSLAMCGIRTWLDHLFAALGTQDDFTGLGHAASNGKDLLLRILDIADTHRALGLKAVTQELAGALGSVLDDFFFDHLVAPLPPPHQHAGGHTTHQHQTPAS